MFWSCVFIVLWAYAECRQRIIGGEEAKPGQFPYIVFIKIGGSGSCTGALLTPEWVLTAAHCIGSDLKIIAGHSDRTSSEAQVRSANRAIKHPKYLRRLPGWYDIGLIEVSPFDMSSEFIGTLNLSAREWPQDRQESRKCVTAGWGRDIHFQVPKILRHLDVIAKHGNHLCPCIARTFVQKQIVCLKIQVNHSPCFGDSGGPLVCDGEGVAITHMALSTTQCDAWSTEVPRVVCGNDKTAVMYMYVCPQLDWIRQYVPQVPPVPISCTANPLLRPQFLITLIFLTIFLNKLHS